MAVESISSGARPKLSFRARVQTDKLTGKPALLYPEGVLILNPTGHAIVLLCTGDATVEEIIQRLATRFQAPPERIAPEVIRYLERLRARNLVELGLPPIAS
jgi:pyrroloquinoline quinone biosynthesis protein D